MSHQFEPQTEQQSVPLTPQKIAIPPTAPPVASTVETYPIQQVTEASNGVTLSSPSPALDSAVEETWQTLMAQWRQENKRTLRHYLPFLSLGIAVFSVPLFLYVAAQTSSNSAAPMFLLFFWLLFWLLMSYEQSKRLIGLTTKQEAILDKLANVEDARAAGSMLEAWQASAFNGRGHAEFGKMLLNLLPRLRPENNNDLTEPQRRILYDNIDHAKALHHPEITLACLETIEQVGDHQALPLLARLVTHDAPTQPEQRIRERARHCLNHLTDTLDFGTKADIPRWIARLPYTSVNSNQPHMREGANEAVIALFALIRLLPQLQPSDTNLLKGSERQYLAESWRWILYSLFGGMGANAQQSRLGSAFTYAVLGALEQIGTGRDTNLSYWLLRDVPMEELPQLRLKARSVNQILAQRGEREKVGQTLLRGASAPTAVPGELLRPATAEQSHVNPQELLRPEEQTGR